MLFNNYEQYIVKWFLKNCSEYFCDYSCFRDWHHLTLRLVQNSRAIFSNFISCLITRGYPHKMIQTTLSEVNFAKRQSALQQKKKTRKQILPFVTTYHPSVRNLKNILMQNWNLIQNQPLLKNIFKDPPIISYKRGQSLKDMLVRAKI